MKGNPLGSVAKAIAAGLGAAVSYFIGVLPAAGGFNDLTTIQWLGVVPIILAVYGIVWMVPNTEN